MSSYDRITGSYTIETVGNTICGTGDIFFTPNNGQGGVHVNGNLYVSGQTITVQSVNSIIDNQFITVSGNVTGTPVLDAGIRVERGLEPDVTIKWNESSNAWQLTNDGTNYSNIAVDPVLRKIQDDLLPRLGNHLYTDCYEIRSPFPCNIILVPGWSETSTQGALQVKHTPPGFVVPFVPQSSLMYAQAPGPGETGIFTTLPTGRQEEFITKRKALIFSLLM
jgi:hypothetical protein